MNKNITFSKKEIETLTRTRPAYLEVSLDKETNTVTLSGDGEDHLMTMQYGPTLTLDSNGETTVFASIEEVLAFLSGRDVRSQRNKETFSRLVMATLNNGGPQDASQLVPNLLLCEPKAGNGDFERGRRWLNEMSEDGLLFRESVKIQGKRGKGVIQYSVDTKEAQEARLEKEAKQKETLAKLKAYTEEFGGEIDEENLTVKFSLEELDKAFSNQLVSV